MHHAQGERRPALMLAPADRRGEGVRGGHSPGRSARGIGAPHLGEQRRRDGHRVTVQIERHRRDHRNGGAPDPQGRGDRHGRKHMGAVENAIFGLVADIGPGHLPVQPQRKAEFLVEAALPGDDQRRAIAQRNETRVQDRQAAGAIIFGHHG